MCWYDIAAPFDVVEAASLPMAASVQQALPWACNLAKRKTVNIYTNSMWAFIVSHDFILYCFHLLLHSIFPSIRIFSNESVLRIRWPKHWSFSFSISPSNEYSGLISFRIQDWFPLGLVWSLCSPRDSQESSPTPQFKNISSSGLSLFYSPAVTSIHEYWKNHSFD